MFEEIVEEKSAKMPTYFIILGQHSSKANGLF